MEKVYSEQSGEVENVASKVDRYLNQLRLPDAEVDLTPPMNKDSLDHDRRGPGDDSGNCAGEDWGRAGRDRTAPTRW